jgi:FkbM family methyltransferase
MARRVGPTGQVHAFEPAPLLLARLRAHVARNSAGAVVSVHGVALSDREGTIDMAVAPAVVGNQGMGSLVNTTHHLLSDRCTVRTATLDAFVTEHNITRIDFMKVDIQGAEPLLLDGGPHVFGTLGPDLIMEVSPKDMAAIGRSGSDVLGRLESYGYAVHGLSPDGTPARILRSADVTDSDFDGIDAVYCTKSRVQKL